MTAIVAWSGGKDCCLALHRARAAGADVRALVAFFDETGERIRSHGVPRDVMEAQADALGLRLISPSAAWSDYEQAFRATLTSQRQEGASRAIFGDIDLQAHRDWIERVCGDLSVAVEFPLWRNSRTALAREVLALGYAPIVVATDDRRLDASFCGRPYDAAFLASLPEDVCPCGEDGEFHTFVADGPAFRAAVPVDVTGVEPHDMSFAAKTYRFHFARLKLRDT